jgi:hypothetical protein
MQAEGKDVTALDVSGGACQVMRMRGIEKVIQSDLFEYAGESFDTLLLLMNGIGICENIEKLDSFLDRLPEIVNKNGQCIFDSTNLIYLYQGHDRGVELNINEDYYGEIQFRLEYDDYFTSSFKWLYIDFDTISWMSEKKGMKAEKVMDGENYHYLARILV